MSVCCECCVLSGIGLCDGLITRPEEFYRLWCVVVCDLETSWMRRPWPTGRDCFLADYRRRWWQLGNTEVQIYSVVSVLGVSIFRRFISSEPIRYSQGLFCAGFWSDCLHARTFLSGFTALPTSCFLCVLLCTVVLLNPYRTNVENRVSS